MTSTEETLRPNWANIAFFAVFHILACAAPWYFSWKAIGVMFLLHWFLGSIGICLGYHRLISHRSFHVPQWLEYVIVTIGALAMQGGPIFWAGNHRQHHGFTEHVDKDPYSAKRGLWWSHMDWVLRTRPEHFNYESYCNFAPDLVSHKFYRFVDKYHISLQIPLILAIYALGETQGLGISFLVYGVCVRAVFLWHSTWLINSACHKWGYRNFDYTEDHATNLWWAALLTYGEGWHNNHHAFPKSARSGLNWWEIDMTWGAISFLKMIGLADKIYLPTPWQSVKSNP